MEEPRRARETVKVARARVFAFSGQTSKGLGATHLVFIEIFGRLATEQIFVYVKFGGQSYMLDLSTINMIPDS